MRGFRIAVVAIAAVLGAAACSSGAGGESVSPADTEYTSSPINDLLGIDIALRSGDLVDLERAAERGVVECMAEAGFEYVPIDFAAQLDTGVDAVDSDSVEYAELYGYGFATDPAFEPVDPADFVDPNDELRAGLSESELTAYEQALYGDAPVEGEQIALDERTGCVAESYRRVYKARDSLVDVEAFFREFAPELNELEARFRADPRFVELENEWSTCMANAGHDFAAREQIFDEIDDRLSAIALPVEPGQEPSNEAIAALDEVADFERSVAVADWTCTQQVDEELRRLRFGYEAIFLAENADRIPGS